MQTWTSLLVPALLGLKGNLEMTLASRLSTAANLGILDDQIKAKEIAKANLALIQIQGVVVGGLAAIFALLVGWIPQLKYFISISSYTGFYFSQIQDTLIPC